MRHFSGTWTVIVNGARSLVATVVPARARVFRTTLFSTPWLIPQLQARGRESMDEVSGYRVDGRVVRLLA